MKRTFIISGLFAAFTLTSGIAYASYGTGSSDPLLSTAQKAEDGQIARRGRGRDDGPGHTRRCRGCDDGPNHTMQGNDLFDQLARRGRGADDAPGDDRRGRGRGKDDGANHA